MLRKIKVFTLALRDIENAIAYYQQEQKGLGKRFEKQVQASFKKIQEFPFAASFAYEGVRYKIIERFPHIVLYEFDDNNIYILRIFSTHQEPAF